MSVYRTIGPLVYHNLGNLCLHWRGVGGIAAIGFGTDLIETHISMAFKSSLCLIMGKMLSD